MILSMHKAEEIIQTVEVRTLNMCYSFARQCIYTLNRQRIFTDSRKCDIKNAEFY